MDPRQAADQPPVLTQADAAMYAAKAAGKGRHAVYDARMPIRTWTAGVLRMLRTQSAASPPPDSR